MQGIGFYGRWEESMRDGCFVRMGPTALGWIVWCVGLWRVTGRRTGGGEDGICRIQEWRRDEDLLDRNSQDTANHI